jgi:hypothetical protein
MAFYKIDDDGIFHEAPNFVRAPDYDLFALQHDQYEYPVHGWYWFDTIEEAYTFFNYIPLIEE